MVKKVNINKKPDNKILNTEQKVDQWVSTPIERSLHLDNLL